jgi:glycosyltransferase involved in cell wall biosynthesis
VVTLTPYDHWRRSHAIHHATSGNLARRGIGDIDTLTVRECLGFSRWQRFRYRVYRHPLVMFGIGPAYLFLLRHRLPIAPMRSAWGPWLSTMATNAAIALLVVTTMWFVGVAPFVLVHLPIALLAASIGVSLFYVQHQFENTVWAKDSAWKLHEAALHGSSHYALPIVMRLAFRNGSVPEVIDKGVTGEVVDSVNEAICKIGSLLALDRGKVRRRFEQRFSAARMALHYAKIYRKLTGAGATHTQERLMPKISSDTGEALY